MSDTPKTEQPKKTVGEAYEDYKVALLGLQKADEAANTMMKAAQKAYADALNVFNQALIDAAKAGAQ